MMSESEKLMHANDHIRRLEDEIKRLKANVWKPVAPGYRFVSFLPARGELVVDTTDAATLRFVSGGDTIGGVRLSPMLRLCHLEMESGVEAEQSDERPS